MNGERIAQALAEEIAARVTWEDGTNYISVADAQRIVREAMSADSPGPDEIRDDERVIGRVCVYRVADTDGGMRDEVRTDDGSEGGELDLPTAVGMLAIAQHTLLWEDDQS